MTNPALLVVDMQNGFCHPDGSFTQIGMGLEGAQDAVRNAAVAVAEARRAAIRSCSPGTCTGRAAPTRAGR
jgi:nicotinamidase-related amidase